MSPNIDRIPFAIRFAGAGAELDVTDTAGRFRDVHLSGAFHGRWDIRVRPLQVRRRAGGALP